MNFENENSKYFNEPFPVFSPDEFVAIIPRHYDYNSRACKLCRDLTTYLDRNLYFSRGEFLYSSI